MKILRSAAIAIILICFAVFAFSQGTTSQGTEFWTAYMDHVDPPDGNPASEMDLYITSDVNTTGTVQIADGSFTQNFTVTANKVTVLAMPATAFLGNQGLFNKGIHITSAKPIAIYAHIFAQNSSGATLLLPVNSMGKDYYSINYTQLANATAYSTFLIIGTEDNTTVEITPSTVLLDGTPANIPFQVKLNKGQVYQGLANADLTGTRITSVSAGTNTCKKIAVFSGSSKIAILCNDKDNSSDNLFQQVYPTASWGKNYITVPLKNRDYDIFRIVLSKPNTNVLLNGARIPPASFTNNLYYEFTSTTPNVIAADQPIQVVQYAVSQGNTLACGNDPADVGDPEMIYLTPLEQTLDRVTLFSTSNFFIEQSYINVTLKTADVKSFTIDGAPYPNFATVPNNTQYSFAQINVNPGPHSIADANGFNAIAYGFGQHESYGYAAGANLKDLETYIALGNPVTKTIQSNGCTGIPYNLQLTLAFKTDSIRWDFKDGSQPLQLVNPPVSDSTKKGTQTLYTYNYPKNPVNYTSGSYTATATVFDPVADVCGSTEVVELDFTISDPPTAKIGVGSACLGDSTAFTDQSTTSSAISSWLWNFGDGQTSILRNPMHAYKASGNYNVTLTVTDAEGCTSGITQPNVHVNAKPIAAFKVLNPGCPGGAIAFADQSTSKDGSITTWIWSYGDGTIDTVTNSGAAISHTYTTTGIDTVKLTVSVSGCTSDVFHQVLIINPVPVVDFALPDVCLADAFAQFADKTTIPDNTEAGFSYLWDFGDPNANGANPNTSTRKNPQHKYSAAANYNVTLTVTSKYGCSTTATKPFTVNGSDPVADFAVENMGSLCSSDSVIFEDKSTVDFGNITKIVWYFDYNNNPQDTVVYYKSTMPASRKYSHYYGIFNSAGQTKNYAVRMLVYSGQTCVSEKGPVTIILNANPTITLSQLGAVCQEAGPVQIAENKNGFIGTGVFTGTAVSSTGLFNPEQAGPGTFTINYTFTAQNGCGYAASQQVSVQAAPSVTTDSVVTVLEGNDITLKATASGIGLSYKWSPSAGLDHDNILDPIASIHNDTRYTLTVTGDNGCSATGAVTVKVLKNIIIPNTFTPNGDGINDVWNIKYIELYPNCTVEIYDRTGQKLFSSNGYAVPWDGTYKGARLPTGTYYFIINPKSGRTITSGAVTIIR